MATTADAAAHLFLTAARFHDLVAQGVITKAERGAYNLNKVREQYIRHIRANASGHGRDTAGLAKARAELAKAQTDTVAMRNAIMKGENAPLAMMKRGLDIVIAACRERMLAVPGKLAGFGVEVEMAARAEIYECLEQLAQPILPPDIPQSLDDMAGENATDATDAAIEEDDDDETGAA